MLSVTINNAYLTNFIILAYEMSLILYTKKFAKYLVFIDKHNIENVVFKCI